MSNAPFKKISMIPVKEMADSPAVRQMLANNVLRNLLKSAASSRSGRLIITSPQRQAIREICASTDSQAGKPERLLIAFKAALNEAANDAKIRPGPDRNDLLAEVVSVFIEELYRGAAERKTFGDGDGRTAARNFIPSRNPGLTDAHP
jgi:hypothetical protein